MPRSAGWSARITTSWWCLSPRASSVRRSRAGRPMPERTWRMRSGPPPGGGSGRSTPGFFLRYFRVGGFLAMHRLLARLVRNRLDLDAALLGYAPRRGQARQGVEGRAHHVVRMGGAHAVRQDIALPGALERGPDGPPGDYPGHQLGGLEQ